MSIHIKDLPLELRELCHKRQKEQGNNTQFDGDLSCGRVSGNFDWLSTAEGSDFWERLNDNKDVTNHPFYPKRELNYEIF